MEQHPILCVRPASGDPVPDSLRSWLGVLQPCFTALNWERVLVIIMGAVLAPGKRTITACLRVTGRVEAGDFASYHQLLNWARCRSEPPQTTEPLEGGVPVAIAVRQVPPRRTRSDHPKNGFEKLSIIRARAPRTTDLARKQRRYPSPLLVAQTCPIQAGLRFPALNQSVARRGTPPRRK